MTEHPEAKIISISQNDTYNFCQCQSCRTLDEVEGSQSASILNFVNRIAEEVEKVSQVSTWTRWLISTRGASEDHQAQGERHREAL